jgi:starvation-inducible DNA-binding protein
MAKFRIRAIDIQLDHDRSHQREYQQQRDQQNPKPSKEPGFDPDTQNAHGKENREKAKKVQNALTRYFHTVVEELGLEAYLSKHTVKDLMDEAGGELRAKKVQLRSKLDEYFKSIEKQAPDAANAFISEPSAKDNQPHGKNVIQWLDRGVIARYRIAALKELNSKHGVKGVSPRTLVATFKNKRATVNYLDAVRLDAVAKTLNILLKEYIKFGLLVKHAHWNTKGSTFSGLHPLYDSTYEHALEAQDLIAERSVQLGIPAEGTVDQICGSLVMLYGPQDMGFMELGYVAEVTRKAKELSTLLHSYLEIMTNFDNTTADVMIEISRQLDKDLWMIEAHIEQVKA